MSKVKCTLAETCRTGTSDWPPVGPLSSLDDKIGDEWRFCSRIRPIDGNEYINCLLYHDKYIGKEPRMVRYKEDADEPE